MRMRITIEYDTDGQEDMSKEQQDWFDGEVTFQDIWELFCAGVPDFKVAFTQVDGE